MSTGQSTPLATAQGSGAPRRSWGGWIDGAALAAFALIGGDDIRISESDSTRPFDESTGKRMDVGGL